MGAKFMNGDKYLKIIHPLLVMRTRASVCVYVYEKREKLWLLEMCT
jgi:hypothetical protein